MDASKEIKSMKLCKLNLFLFSLGLIVLKSSGKRSAFLRSSWKHDKMRESKKNRLVNRPQVQYTNPSIG